MHYHQYSARNFQRDVIFRDFPQVVVCAPYVTYFEVTLKYGGDKVFWDISCNFGRLYQLLR